MKIHSMEKKMIKFNKCYVFRFFRVLFYNWLNAPLTHSIADEQ